MVRLYCSTRFGYERLSFVRSTSYEYGARSKAAVEALISVGLRAMCEMMPLWGVSRAEKLGWEEGASEYTNSADIL